MCRPSAITTPHVLKHCCGSPRTIEVLLNAYSRLKVTDAWVESVSSEALEAKFEESALLDMCEHREFYESVFSLGRTPRALQHLARFRVRVFLEGRVHKVVPKLDLPTFIKNYLLLEYRGYVH
ncbi:Ankyrin repeat and SOCS box protein 16 [Liparis tanakae]|uniref:Ankyrin repeat and SOCS box protein 16 n=1 Tax=Liparis tanakae TaxID=230148 RepID=A0A4Z2GRP2_9TELE|nr:Ankyrin repeat and SOCS box protein 16 [Liparis tanakae]